jgi:FAD binding domain
MPGRRPSAYAVKARSSGDVAAAVNFARDNNLRLVVKGAGHSYQGTSNAPDSLLIWTRAMDKVTLHDAFAPQGCEGKIAPVPRVSAEAGAVWIDLYHAVTGEADRYVQGGGFRAAASATSRRALERRPRACSKPRSSPLTVPFALRTPVPIRICFGRSRAAATEAGAWSRA